MGCGCEATIIASDPRAVIWMHIFGRLSFPLRHPLPMDMGSVVGVGYEGDASAFTPEERKRFVEKMVERFKIPKEEVEAGLSYGVVPIKAAGVIITICERHFRAVL